MEATVFAALMFLAILMIVGSMLLGQQLDPVQARLRQIAVRPKSLEELELQRPLSERTIKPIINSLSRLIGRFYPANTVRGLALKLRRAGMESTSTEFLLGVKGFAAIVGFVGAGALANLVTSDASLGIVGALFGMVLAFMAPDFFLSNKAGKRNTEILEALPDALDLLTISVEAGLGFDAGLIKVTEKMKGPLSDEFRRASGEQRVGKSRQEAMRGIMARVELKELHSFISAIIQADQLGVPMAKVLRIQSEQLRQSRRQRAEEKAARAPILIMLPTVGCIFPSLFIVILAPAGITAMSSCGSF